MQRITDENIKIREINESDLDYLNVLSLREDYIDFVNFDILLNDKYVNNYILEARECVLGACMIKTELANNIKVSYPYIYLEKRINYLSVSCLFRVISFIFEEPENEIVRFAVYSNNVKMLSLVKKFNIRNEGVLRYNKNNKGMTIDKYIYSLSREEYNAIKGLVNAKF